jgi:hypothetical protein
MGAYKFIHESWGRARGKGGVVSKGHRVDVVGERFTWDAPSFHDQSYRLSLSKNAARPKVGKVCAKRVLD